MFNVPIFFPWYSAPIECAASSIMGIPYFCAIFLILSYSHGCPARSTAIIAFVFLVIFCSILFGSIFRVFLSMSANTGLAPQCIMTFAVDGKVIAHGQQKSSFRGEVTKAMKEYGRAAVRFTGDLVQESELPLLYLSE